MFSFFCPYKCISSYVHLKLIRRPLKHRTYKKKIKYHFMIYRDFLNFYFLSPTEAYCDPVGSLRNGHIDYTPSSPQYGSFHYLGTRYDAWCDDKYLMVGNSTATCEQVDDGVDPVWSSVHGDCSKIYQCDHLYL